MQTASRSGLKIATSNNESVNKGEWKMTPERKKWWDSLPQGERELREAIAEREKWIKINKSHLPDGITDIEYLKKLLRRQKLIVKALKHELERGGKCGLVYRNVSNILMPTCDVCGAVVSGGIVKPVKYCPHCGRKIKELE